MRLCSHIDFLVRHKELTYLNFPQNCCFFFTYSIVWYTREHNVSETGSVSVLTPLIEISSF
jgi:hypothetical protein